VAPRAPTDEKFYANSILGAMVRPPSRSEGEIRDGGHFLR
jgi:hypothetical protein